MGAAEKGGGGAGRAGSGDSNEGGGRGNVFDYLGRFGTDAEVAEVGQFFGCRPRARAVSDLEGGAHHGGDVTPGVYGESGEVADF